MSDSSENIAGPSIEMEENSVFEYIRKEVTKWFSDEDAATRLDEALAIEANRTCIQQFLQDSSTQVLFIQRTCTKNDANAQATQDGEEEGAIAYCTSNNYQSTNSSAAIFQLVKRDGPRKIANGVPFEDQLDVFTLAKSKPQRNKGSLRSRIQSFFQCTSFTKATCWGMNALLTLLAIGLAIGAYFGKLWPLYILAIICLVIDIGLFYYNSKKACCS